MSNHEDDNHGVEEEFPGTTKAADAVIKPPAPPQPLPELDVLDLDSVLVHTQKIRLGIQQKINQALAQEVSAEMLSVLLKTAGDMDKAVVARRRVGIEEEAAKTAEESSRDNAALLRSITERAFQLPTGTLANREIPKLGNDASVDLVPGELDQGTHELSYDAFAKGRAEPPGNP